MQLKLEAEEREHKRHDEVELKVLELQQAAELKQQQLKFESEETERKRDAQFDALINQLTQANNDSLAFSKWAKQDEEATTRQREEIRTQRWEKERADREKKNTYRQLNEVTEADHFPDVGRSIHSKIHHKLGSNQRLLSDTGSQGGPEEDCLLPRQASGSFL